jgi:RNA polymerase sigma factor (sigma-70 family)
MSCISSPQGEGPPLSAIRSPQGAAGHDLPALVRRARQGDDAAWKRLVTRFTPLIRDVARRHRLQPCDAEDVAQTIWTQLLVDIDRIREPAALPGWLSTATARQCLRVLRDPARRHLSDDPRLGERPGPANVELELLQRERRAVVAGALGELPERHRELIVLLASEPEPDYQKVSRTLAMPIGSIGPIRRRTIERLQRHPSIRAYCATG